MSTGNGPVFLKACHSGTAPDVRIWPEFDRIPFANAAQSFSSFVSVATGMLCVQFVCLYTKWCTAPQDGDLPATRGGMQQPSSAEAALEEPVAALKRKRQDKKGKGKARQTDDVPTDESSDTESSRSPSPEPFPESFPEQFLEPVHNVDMAHDLQARPLLTSTQNEAANLRDGGKDPQNEIEGDKETDLIISSLGPWLQAELLQLDALDQADPLAMLRLTAKFDLER